MQAVTKIADLTKFRESTWRFLCKLHQQRWAWHVGEFDDFGDFYANYITRDESNMLANLAILAIFMQISSPEMGLTCWRILCKSHHQRWVWHVGEFGDFYANYITRDGCNELANLAILVTFMQFTSLEMVVTWWRFDNFGDFDYIMSGAESIV